MPTTHAKKFVSADPNKCVGCAVCEYTCSMVKEKTYNPTKSRIRTVRLNPFANLAVTCRLCEDPPCVAACPRDALTQSEETGIIMVDEDKCNETKVVYICDLCQDQGKPQCIEWCPEEALDLVTSDILAQKARRSIVRKLFQEAMKAVPV